MSKPDRDALVAVLGVVEGVRQIVSDVTHSLGEWTAEDNGKNA